MSVVNDLGTVLSESNDLQFGTSLFLNFFPEEPDEVTSIHVTGGLPPQYTHDSLTPSIVTTNVQVLVRRFDPVDGLDIANEVYSTLSAISNQSISETFYLLVMPTSVPILVERDKGGRSLFAVNFTVKHRT